MEISFAQWKINNTKNKMVGVIDEPKNYSEYCILIYSNLPSHWYTTLYHVEIEVAWLSSCRSEDTEPHYQMNTNDSQHF